VSEKYTLIAAEQNYDEAPSISAMCAALAVSHSGFYDWARATPSARALRRAKVATYVQSAFDAGRG